MRWRGCRSRGLRGRDHVAGREFVSDLVGLAGEELLASFGSLHHLGKTDAGAVGIDAVGELLHDDIGRE